MILSDKPVGLSDRDSELPVAKASWPALLVPPLPAAAFVYSHR